MPDLSSNVNVYSTAMAILDKEGWQLGAIPIPYKEENGIIGLYEAKKDGVELLADNPLELLALAKINDYHKPHDRKPYWWSIESTVLEELEDDTLERSFIQFLESEEEAAKIVIQTAIEESKLDPEVTVEERIGISATCLKDLLERFPDIN